MIVRDQVKLRPFCACDQSAAKQLVLAGLGERWGWIDPTLNPDLSDIATTYADGVFWVGYLGDALVATGALTPDVTPPDVTPPDVTPPDVTPPDVTPQGINALRVVRMSVRADLRGQGIGRRMLDALLDAARLRGCALIVLETTSTWTDAVRFYVRYGFQVVEERDGETHMQLEIGNPE